MIGLRPYILSLVAGAIICGIITAINPKSSSKKYFNFICGLFLTVTLLRPIVGIRLPELPDLNEYISQAENITAEGKRISLSSQEKIILQECETYILDKAEELQMTLSVKVTIGEREGKPVPVQAEMIGIFSDESQQCLSEIIADDLGVSGENQEWIYQMS